MIQAKTPPSAQALSNLSPLLSSLTHEVMSDSLVPALEKAIKKSPAGVLAAVAALAAQLNLDLSRYVEGLFLPPALRMIKSLEEEPRQEATRLFAALAAKVSDAPAFTKIVVEVSIAQPLWTSDRCSLCFTLIHTPMSPSVPRRRAC